ncbi:hypothetical protein ABBQ38_000967 [Trebouxia sp. C0009 RCD-2024]
MAADAAAPTARPSRTAETSTSTLWAPDAPLLRGLTATPTLPPGTGKDALLHHQQSRPSDAAQYAQQEPQQGELSATQTAQPTVLSVQSAPVASVATTSNDAEVSQPPHSARAAREQMQHHDANQPWAGAWSQPALPAVTVRSGLGRASLGVHQRRRETDAAVAVPAFRQQPRHSGGPQAARSLSWNQSAEQPMDNLVISGKFAE